MIISWNIFETIDPEKHRKCSTWQKRLKTLDLAAFWYIAYQPDKVLRYGKFNQIEHSEHPTVVQRGDERTINIYAAVSDVA